MPQSGYLNDKSLYFNDSLKVAIQLPGDFILYKHQNNNGVFLKHLTRADRKILKLLGMKDNNSTILFAGTPVIPPYYNLIGILQNSGDNIAVSAVNRLKIDGIDIGVGTIPFDKKLIKLIYYNRVDTACAYCDIDSITVSNNRRIRALLKSRDHYKVTIKVNFNTLDKL